MSRLAAPLAAYAAYHRHPVNRAVHAVGIPLITASLVLLLAYVPSGLGAFPLWAALAATLASTWYVRLDAALGLATAALLAAAVGASWWTVAGSGAATWPWAVGAHAAGWAAQFVGHAVWEKRRPALVDNVAQALVAPMFVVAEAACALGLRPGLRPALAGEAAGA